MRSFSPCTLLALPLLFVAACGHEDKPANTGYEPAMTPAAHTAPSAPEELGAEASERLSDPQIMTILRAVNAAEVNQARTVVAKVVTPAVKEFAEMMIAQHGQAVKDIDARTSKLGYAPTDSQLATELGVEATRVEHELAKTNDASIERRYMMAQIDAHRQVLDAIDTRLLPAARNEDVKNVLQATRPIVEGHLSRAQRILDSLK